MKKIILFILLIFLTSCSKNSLKTETTNSGETLNIQNSKELSKGEEISILTKKTSEVLANYEKLSLSMQSKLECVGLFPIYDGIGEEQRKISQEFVDNCSKIKQKALVGIDEKNKNFSISNCKSTIENKFKALTGEDAKQFMTQEIESCEFSIALKTGCEKLDTKGKIDKCNDLKAFAVKNQEIQMYNNFEISNYF